MTTYICKLISRLTIFRTRYRINRRGGNKTGDLPLEDQRDTMDAVKELNDNQEPMKLIPWEDIWTSLRIARVRGNGDMIEVFYDTLFREAVFDDHGAWSLDFEKRH
jgi:hypothetical protein